MEQNEIDRIVQRFEQLHRDNADRDNRVIEKLDQVQSAITDVLAELRAESAERGEWLIRNTRKTAIASQRNQQILLGTFTLVAVGVLFYSLADPIDRAKFVSDGLKWIGVAIISWLTLVLGLKPSTGSSSPPPPAPNAAEPTDRTSQ